MSENTEFDLVVVGGGPAGYVGAIRAAQLGMRVGVVERDKLGGICLNWGCIPTKALLAGAEFYHRLKHDAADWGIHADNVRHDWQRVIARLRGVADTLNRGIESLFRKNRITHIDGVARIENSNNVIVANPDGGPEKTLVAKKVLVATGAGPRPLPGTDFDGERIISYKEAMVLPEQPKELLIIGAGAIGMEFAYFFNAFGTKVTVVEMLDRLLPVEDEEVSKLIGRSFRKQGIDCHTSMMTRKITRTEKGVEVVVCPPNHETDGETITADKVLVAIGVTGRVAGLFGDDVKVNIEKGHIAVDKTTYQTSVENIHAVGDVIGPPWLAHVASEEAVIAVEQMAGHKPTPIDYECIPGCTYCHPQVASVGLTERACKERGLDYSVGKFPLQASGKAQALGETQGFVKIITGKEYGEILGAHMIGENVTELIAELGLAKRLEATAGEIIATIHAHPTLSESVHEAALGTEDRMLHF